MVATASLRDELCARGFSNLLAWTRGVDTDRFRPRDVRLFGPGPVFLSVGRVSKEKNLEAFLHLELSGRKVVVGEGPLLPALRRRYPDVLFTGAKQGEELAACYASADVFVFPSRTDTFGLVLLEAMASGVPVAAFPVTGPRDVVAHGTSGILDQDLGRAARAALKLDPANARRHALQFSWGVSAMQFVGNVVSASAPGRTFTAPIGAFRVPS
jgi:glycosyltransferase involved in cell wall biosynthesis